MSYMATSVHKILRDNPYSVIEEATIPASLLSEGFPSVVKVYYADSFDSDLKKEEIQSSDLLSYNTDDKGYHVAINVESSFFKTHLMKRNFIVEIEGVTKLVYSIKPSSVNLDNIKITSKLIDGIEVGGIGYISSEGNAELWKNPDKEEQTIFATQLNRTYYSTDVVTIGEEYADQTLASLEPPLLYFGFRNDDTNEGSFDYNSYQFVLGSGATVSDGNLVLTNNGTVSNPDSGAELKLYGLDSIPKKFTELGSFTMAFDFEYSDDSLMATDIGASIFQIAMSDEVEPVVVPYVAFGSSTNKSIGPNTLQLHDSSPAVPGVKTWTNYRTGFKPNTRINVVISYNNTPDSDNNRNVLVWVNGTQCSYFSISDEYTDLYFHGIKFGGVYKESKCSSLKISNLSIYGTALTTTPKTEAERTKKILSFFYANPGDKLPAIVVENEVAQKLDVALDNGGGIINLETNYNHGPLTINTNGNYIKGGINGEQRELLLGQNQSDRVINVIGTNSSMMFDWIQIGVEQQALSVINFEATEVLFDNSVFKNITFNLSGNSTVLFRNSKFINCKFVGKSYLSGSTPICENNLALINCSATDGFSVNCIQTVRFYQTGFQADNEHPVSITNYDSASFRTCGFGNSETNGDLDVYFDIGYDDTYLEENDPLIDYEFKTTTLFENCSEQSYNGNTRGDILLKPSNGSIDFSKCFFSENFSISSPNDLDNTCDVKILFSTFEHLHFTNWHPFNSLIISNCTFANSITVGQSLTSPDSYIIQSTILGAYDVVKKSKPNVREPFFKEVVNTLVISCVPEAEDPDDPHAWEKTEIILGTNSEGKTDTGSRIYYFDERKVQRIKFSGETGYWKFLNGSLKALYYMSIPSTLTYFDLSTIYYEGFDVIDTYYSDFDIFGNYRTDESPKCGCEAKVVSQLVGGTISLYYSETAKGNATFNEAKALYQKPILVKEFEINPQSKNVYDFTWELDGVQQTHGIDESRSIVYCPYTINTKDTGKELVCHCSFDAEDDEDMTYEISNSVKLLVATVPTLTYVSQEVLGWTNTMVKIGVSIDGLSDEEVMNFPSTKIAWYKRVEGDIFRYLENSFTFIDDTTYAVPRVMSDLVFPLASKSDEAYYQAEMEYRPRGFTSSKTIKALSAYGVEEPVSLSIRYNVIIDQNETTHGNIDLHVGDSFTLVGALEQGDAPWFEWQKTTSLDSGEWTTVFGPTKNFVSYTNTLYDLDETGVYYRLHAYNYVDENAAEPVIATEDFSSTYVLVRVFKKLATGDEMSSNIVLFKIPITSLSNTTIDPDYNYRVFTSLDNQDQNYSTDELSSFPVLHRRVDDDLWYYDGIDKEYKQNYVKYSFPSDVDIDKYNLSFGVATDKLDTVDGVRKGGWLYVLDLESLNDDIDYRINKPKIAIDILSAYESEPATDSVQFSNLGANVYARNGYIAVTDPTARIIKDNSASEFDVFTNPKIEVFNNEAIWDIKLGSAYETYPIIQLLEASNEYAITDIRYIDNQQLIRVRLSTPANELPEAKFKIQVLGKKYSVPTEELACYDILNPELPVVDGIATWSFEIPHEFNTYPLLQMYDHDGNVVACDYYYDFDSRFVTVKIQSTESVIITEKFRCAAIGKSTFVSTEEDYVNTIIQNDVKNPTIYSVDGYCTWDIDFSERFNTIPSLQIFDEKEGNNKWSRSLVDIIYDNGATKATLVFESKESIPSGSLNVVIVGKKYDGSNDEITTLRENAGRVLLFKYDGNAGTVKLIKVIKSPVEQPNGYFGEAVEFDEHGNILISAPGENNLRKIGYYKKDHVIYPSYNNENYLEFGTQGRIYVFKIKDLEDAGMMDVVEPIQILSNEAVWKTIDYNTGSWGYLEKLYRVQSLYTIKDIETNGNKVNEGFSDIASYLEYYEFNHTYDFQYRKYFPVPYTDADFKQERSNSDHFKIEYRQIYFTSNVNERYGTSMSYDNDVLIVGAPYYDSYKGLVEAWKYDKSSGTYKAKTYMKNPLYGNELLFGQNCEMSSNYALVTYRQAASRQGVLLLDYTSANQLENNNIIITPNVGLSSRSFGDALDSNSSTFVIGSPNEGKIYRYEYVSSKEEGKYFNLIQTINLQKYGIATRANGQNNIVITKDKILTAYNSFGSSTSELKELVKYYERNEDTNEMVEKTKEQNLVSVGAGAVLQFTLIGGDYKF